MKKLLSILLSSSALLVGSYAMAQDVVRIDMAPADVTYTTVTTETMNGLDVIPNDVALRPVRGYYFVNVGGEEQVCKTRKITKFKNKQGRIVKYKKTKLFCYPASEFTFAS